MAISGLSIGFSGLIEDPRRVVSPAKNPSIFQILQYPFLKGGLVYGLHRLNIKCLISTLQLNKIHCILGSERNDDNERKI